VDAGCEWFNDCGGCVADAGCGWCSNDPKGAGTGTLTSLPGLTATGFSGTDDEGNPLPIGKNDTASQPIAGYPVQDGMIHIRGQYREVVATEYTQFDGTTPATMTGALQSSLRFEGSGYIASPYFGYTSHDSTRGYSIVGVHKTKFLSELKAGYTVRPYNHTAYTVQSVQSDVMLTTTFAIGESFADIEYQIGNYKCSGVISYPDTSSTELHGSWAPNPTKFTTELKDGFTIGTGTEDQSHPDSPARVGSVVNDQKLILSSKFIQTFESEPLWVRDGARGTGLISATASSNRITGSDPCAPGYACHPETAFIDELRVDDVIEIVNATASENGVANHFFHTIAAIYDDSHLKLGECIMGDDNKHDYSGGAPNNPCTGMSDLVSQGKLPTTTKFLIHTFSSESYTYTRRISGGLKSDYVGADEFAKARVTVDSTQEPDQSLTHVLGKDYTIVAQVLQATTEMSSQNNNLPPRFERRKIMDITNANTMVIDKKFSQNFENADVAQFSPAVTHFHYESCSSAAPENAADRTENGFGTITHTGTTDVYNNVQFSEVTSVTAHFVHNAFAVGYELIDRSSQVTRTITKIISDTKIHVNRAFPAGFSNHAYQIKVKKGWDKGAHSMDGKNFNDDSAYGSDFFLHSNPQYGTGGSNSRQSYRITVEEQVYSHQMKADTTTSGRLIKKQDPYIRMAPVCYGNGRCVAKTSHSLIGIEGTAADGGYTTNGKIASSSVQNNVYDLVAVGARSDGSSEPDTAPYYNDCKPSCTITAYYKGIAETRSVVGTVRAHNNTHLYTELPFTHNNISMYNNHKVPGMIPDGVTAYNPLSGINFRVRYVTGTGTVHWCPNGNLDGKNCGDAITGSLQDKYSQSRARFTLTGASKETKTKFHSETSTQWSLTVPCNQYCYNTITDMVIDESETSRLSNPTCAASVTDPDTLVVQPVTTIVPENRTIMTISSDTKLTVNTGFTQSNNKVPYCIGSIPALGRVTAAQGHKTVKGDDDTRFMEQLKVHYYITVAGVERRINSIQDQNTLTVDAPFPGGIGTKSQMTFRGKVGTGEVSTSSGDTEVLGTLDVTETKFSQELQTGYLLMVGSHYKVITSITSATKLEVDTPFTLYEHDDTGATYGIWRNSYNYESCYTYELGDEPSNTVSTPYHEHTYQNKHVFVEDACEIKPGNNGFRLASIAWPDKWSYYKVRPSHSNMNVQIVATTTEDNIQMVWKKDSVPTTSSYDGASVRQSNPYAMTIPSSDITCGETFVGYDVTLTLGAQSHISTAFANLKAVLEQDNSASRNDKFESVNRNPTRRDIFDNRGSAGLAVHGLADNVFQSDYLEYVTMSEESSFAPSNCSFFYIGVRGANRYPQKAGASEYSLVVYTEFEFGDFLCSDAGGDFDTSDGTAANPSPACQYLGLTVIEDAAFMRNLEDSRSVMRLTPASNQRKGAMYYSTKVHLYDGFETTFTFRISHFTVGCNTVHAPSGFCGGGDGFSFIVHDQLDGDTDIGCHGAAMGFATITRENQGDDWTRTRCISYDDSTSYDGSGSLGSRGEPGCDSGLESTEVDSMGVPDWNHGVQAKYTAMDDGVFGEQCALNALCTIDAQGRHGCGDQNGMCGLPSCEKAIGNILAIEFDTWNNLNLHDPKQGISRWWLNSTDYVGYNDNHIAIFSSDHADGTSNNHASANHFAATPSIPNLADGKIHEVKIKYWPQHDGKRIRKCKKNRGAAHETSIPLHGDCQDLSVSTGAALQRPAPDHCYCGQFHSTKPGNLAIFIDDMKRPVLQTKISLRKGEASASCSDADTDRHILDMQGNAYIGFTAATGGERTGIAYDEFGVTTTIDYTRGTYGTSFAEFTQYQAANEAVQLKRGAAQIHEILSWRFCNKIGCVPI
jgi:hypothetical protein